MESASLLEVRPPWPDEIWRLRHFLPAAYLYDEEPRFQVAVRGRVERIVGAAAVTTKSHGGALEAFLLVRAEQLPERLEILEALIRNCLAAAWEAGAAIVTLAQSIAAGGEAAAMLRRIGFAEFETHEVYEVQAQPLLERLERIHSRLRARDLIPPGVELTTLQPAVIGQVRGFLSRHMPQRISSLALGSSGYKPEHSLALWLDGELKGVFLVRRTGDTSHTGLRLVAPELRGGLAWANLLLLHASVASGVRDGLVRARFELNPALHEDTVQLAGTLGATLVERPALFRMSGPG